MTILLWGPSFNQAWPPQPASVFVKDEHPWLVALRGGR